MNRMSRIKWLLPVLLIGLAVFVTKLPTSTAELVLADGPLTADELHHIRPLADLLPDEVLINEPLAQHSETADTAAQLDDATHGTY